MTLHLLGLPHTETTRAFESCAFTAKTRKFATMMTAQRHDVILYAGEANEADVKEHVTVVTCAEQQEWWPWYSPTGHRVFDDFDAAKPGWQTFNQRTIAAMSGRTKPGDILALTMGTSQRVVAEAFPHLPAVEVGVGYSGVWSPYRVYESYAWQNYLMRWYHSDDDQVRFYDDVIPNFFERDAFPLGDGKGGYYLFMGRLMGRKGPTIAAEACKRIGAKLVVAGQGAQSWSKKKIVCTDGTVIDGDVEYIGVLGPEERARVMGGATAVFVPTLYLEPFGGVSVEAQMCGTPAIVTPSGGLVENVRSRWICHTLAEFAAAAESAATLTLADRVAIQLRAQAIWSTDRIGPRYTRYLDRISGLSGAGWYS